MNQNFIEWLEENKDKYNVKIIENPSEEQKEQFEKNCQDFIDWLSEFKSNINK